MVMAAVANTASVVAQNRVGEMAEAGDECDEVVQEDSSTSMKWEAPAASTLESVEVAVSTFAAAGAGMNI
ncbi:hypothetical protein MLD38_014699 [Melastoma candidum]|uniref:Uncharacterized protein n=1 Tax=Melastoma candidum TaxID=119954 RepID=A0ACB9RE78_9MYRT|nr:hypothetical protein MLD38_014699 [Melastoma candidum]